MSLHTCQECFHWVDKTCRAGPPTALASGEAVWPATLPTDWCYRFKPQVQAEGHDRKFTDEQVLECVRVYDCEVKIGETTLPRSAIKRTELISILKLDFGVTYTPALRRIEKLVRRGALKMGDNPWPKEGDTPGIYVWMGNAESEPKPTNTRIQLLDLLRELTPTRETALSVRGVTKAVAPALGLSSTSVHRKLLALEKDGLVQRCDRGYYATENI